MLSTYGKWPSKYLWLKILLKTFSRNPFRSTKLLFRFLSGRISAHNFSLHAYGLVILEDVMKVSDRIGIKPFLFFGTLRGYFLCKDFLPYSEDIDFAIFEEDWEKRSLLKLYLSEVGYESIVDNEYELLVRHREHQSLMIDFSLVYREGDYIFTTLELSDDEKSIKHQYFPLEIFRPLHRSLFLNIQVWILAQPREFLQMHYGKEWQNIFKKVKNMEESNIRYDPIIGPKPNF